MGETDCGAIWVFFLRAGLKPSHILKASPQGYSQLKRFLSSEMPSPPPLPGHSHFRTGPCRGTGTPVWDRPAPALWAPAPGDGCGLFVTHHSPVSPSAPSYVLRGHTGFHPKSSLKESSRLQHFYLRICPWWTQPVTPVQTHGCDLPPPVEREVGKNWGGGAPLASCGRCCGLCGAT